MEAAKRDVIMNFPQESGTKQVRFIFATVVCPFGAVDDCVYGPFSSATKAQTHASFVFVFANVHMWNPIV